MFHIFANSFFFCLAAFFAARLLSCLLFVSNLVMWPLLCTICSSQEMWFSRKKELGRNILWLSSVHPTTNLFIQHILFTFFASSIQKMFLSRSKRKACNQSIVWFCIFPPNYFRNISIGQTAQYLFLLGKWVNMSEFIATLSQKRFVYGKNKNFKQIICLSMKIRENSTSSTSLSSK